MKPWVKTSKHILPSSSRRSPVGRVLAVLTFYLLFGGFDMRHHPRHVDTVPVQVLQEDICIPSCECASLRTMESDVLLI